MDNEESRTLRSGETALKNYGNPEGRIGTESGEDFCGRLRRITTEHCILWHPLAIAADHDNLRQSECNADQLPGSKHR